tara:strand:- start:1481 stop:1669 length:189 start_codon:yes stop_codon:yes gene_type:complete
LAAPYFSTTKYYTVTRGYYNDDVIPENGHIEAVDNSPMSKNDKLICLPVFSSAILNALYLTV